MDNKLKIGGHFIPHTKRSKLKISLNRTGKGLNERNNNWAGDKVGYNALHTWVQRHYDKPDTCEKCNKSKLSGKKIVWANKSGKYLRKRSDWLRLCSYCHINYDGYKRWLGHIKNESKVCKVGGCKRSVQAKDLCIKHYNQKRKEIGLWAS